MTAPKVYASICAVQAALSKIGISKDRKNPKQDYMFRGVDDVYAALAPLLAEHQLVILPHFSMRTENERSTSSGGKMLHVVVEGHYEIVSAQDGSMCTVNLFGEAMDSGDKSTNKAMSAAYKYMAFQTFCIPLAGGGNDDADKDSPEPTSRAQAARKPESQANATRQPSAAQVASVRGENDASYNKDVAASLKTITDAKTKRDRFAALMGAKQKYPAGSEALRACNNLYSTLEKQADKNPAAGTEPGHMPNTGQPKFSDADPPPMDDIPNF